MVRPSIASLVAGISFLALGACGRKGPAPEPPIVQRDYGSEKLTIGRGANAGTDGPALALTARGVLYRVGAKVEQVAEGVRCLGSAGAEARVVTDEGIVRVGLESVTSEGPAIEGLTRCGVGADGGVVAITAAGVVRVDATGPKPLAALPGKEAPVGVTSDGDGTVWVLDAQRLHAWKNGAWKSAFSQSVNGSSAEMIGLDVVADGSIVVLNEFRDYAVITKGKSRSPYIPAGLGHMIPDAVGSGGDGTIWAGDYQYVAWVNGESDRQFERVDVGFHGGKPTAVTGDGRGRGWFANEVSLAVVTQDRKLVAEIGREAFGDENVERLLVVGAGPPAVESRKPAGFKGKVTGTVRVRDEVVPGAHLYLCEAPPEKFRDPCEGAASRFESVSDEEGVFTFDDVPPLDMRLVVEVGNHRFLPFDARCCGLMSRDRPYKMRFDIGDSIDGQGKPLCPPPAPGGRPTPCKIPGILSHPPTTP